MRKLQAPTVEQDRDEVTLRHPAYGQLQLSRVSGTQELYGSEFKHQHYIGITLTRSKHVRNLSNDWFHPQEQLFRVYLSEAQFASFITGAGLGSGTPCTIAHVLCEAMPEIERQQTKRDVFTNEMGESIKKALDGLAKLRQQINDSKQTEKAKREMLATVENQIDRLRGSVKFIADQFAEHMEHVVEKAKQEITGYVAAHPALTSKIDLDRIAE